MGMARPRLIFMLMTVCVCLGIMGGVLLAQQPESTSAPFDCSAEGLDQSMQSMGDQFPLDFAADTQNATANLYRRGLLYQQIALECGYTPGSTEIKAGINLTLRVTDLQTIIQA